MKVLATGWLDDWMTWLLDDWMTGWLGWLDDWMTGWLLDDLATGWLDDWMTKWRCWLLDDLATWMSGWVDDWMTGWLNEGVGYWMTVFFHKYSQFSFEVVFELAFAKVITLCIMYSCEYNRAPKRLYLKQKTVLTSKLLRTEKSIAP